MVEAFAAAIVLAACSWALRIVLARRGPSSDPDPLLIDKVVHYGVVGALGALWFVGGHAAIGFGGFVGLVIAYWAWHFRHRPVEQQPSAS